MAKETQRCCWNFVLRVQKILFLVPKFKNAQMFSFCVLTSKKCLRKRFGGLVKSVLVLSTVTFWGRLFFWRFFFCNIENKFYASWQKKLSEVVKTSFYESRRSIFSLEKLENAQMCSFLVLTAKRILRKLLAELSKVNLYCPE